jgi:N-acetylglucosamine-6-phosphate deacetylase
MRLLVKNGLVLQRDGTFVKAHVYVEGGTIASLSYGEAPPLREADCVLDADGLLVSPGLIDTHLHGGNTFAFDRADTDWKKLETRLSSIGVTSILAAGTSLPLEDMFGFIDRAAALVKNNDSNAVEIMGLYMEGPYINTKKRGAHREECIRPGSVDEVWQILNRSGGLVKVWALAPEIKENLALVKHLTAAGISVTLAHTEAHYDDAMAAFSAGANRITHTFNAMPVLSHRYEGIVSAAWQRGAYMELIADGHHVSPTIVKMLVSASDPAKIILISDNNEFAGLPDGTYFRGTRRLFLANGEITNEAGSLAGSISSLNRYARNLVLWGFPMGAALKMVTENPARSVGVFNRKGSIEVGKDADIVLLDGQFEAMLTIRAGRIVYRA